MAKPSGAGRAPTPAAPIFRSPRRAGTTPPQWAATWRARRFAGVLVSPLQRARETCRLAGYENALIDPDLSEWDYGDYEGRTTPQIQADHPGWSLWSDGVPNGETIAQVAARAEKVIARALAVGGDADVALFAHGHILRVLAARWLGLPPEDGRLFALGTAAVSTLGYERETRVITRWNLSLSA